MRFYESWESIQEAVREAGGGKVCSSLSQGFSITSKKVFLRMEHMHCRGVSLDEDDLLRLLEEMRRLRTSGERPPDFSELLAMEDDDMSNTLSDYSMEP